LVFACAILTTGCASFRGIPSHGGGKRFDEEQRIVAGAIRYAVSDMRFAELAGKRVRLQVTSIPTSGSGNLNPGGLQDISLGLNHYDNISRMVRAFAAQNSASDSTTYRWNDNEDDWDRFQHVDGASTHDGKVVGENREDSRTTMNAGLRYRLDHSYFTQRENTQGDVAYLQAVLDMKASHDGVAIVGNGPECVLHVLVDVLGTNRRRRDFVLWKRDDLAATCELTYYARSLGKGELIFAARRAAGRAVYLEDRVWPVGWQNVSRSFSEHEVAAFPVSCSDSDRLAATGHGNGEHGDQPAGEVEEAENGTADSLVERARSQLRVGNQRDAFESLRAVINLDASHPGLQEVEDEFNLDLPIP